MSRRLIQVKSREQMIERYPVEGLVPQWYFAVHETSAGAWTVEGCDGWGRRVQRSGPNADDVLAACVDDARAITSTAPIPTTIYVKLLDEGVDVWRPVVATRLASGSYRIDERSVDIEDEMWEFMPGTAVKCVERRLSGGVHLVAIERADDDA